ncbi:MAG TPA: cytochrome c oxidase subunit II [Candidatus Thermoplasmatota archaeon]|nr:cytochrome c oxidase subunit II [Candidatus Thermoplasmatota archaeon]
MRRLASASLVLLLALLVLAPAAEAGLGMPDALTPRGKVVGGLYEMITILGIIMFVIVFAWLVVVIWRFREGTGHGKSTREKERHSLKAELTWTLVPLALVMWIGYSAYGGLVTLDHGIPIDQTAMEIKVQGSQWNWQFDYGSNVTLLSNPDQTTGNVSVANTFLVPQDTNILFNITSADVIHAFQVLDANRAFVMFNDANPLGANKYALQTANFPAGSYMVQCNKMCLNPGHAYMRAAIQAVPKAQFDHWLAEKTASAGSDLVTKLPVQVIGGTLRTLDGKPVPAQTLAVSTFTTPRLLLDVQGNHGQLTIEGAGQTRTIPSTEAVNTFAAFDFPNAGNYTLKVTDTTGDKSTTSALAVSVISATPVKVDLGNYALIPAHIDLKAGTTYLIQVPNVHSTTHDLQIGHWDPTNPTILAGSDTVVPGGSLSFLYTPKDSDKGALDMWCNQGGPTGHHNLGMAGTVTVS